MTATGAFKKLFKVYAPYKTKGAGRNRPPLISSKQFRNDQGVHLPEVGTPGVSAGRGLKSAGAGSISLSPE